MKLLLDTHALLWWLADDPRLGAQARKMMKEPGNDIVVSTVSIWEIIVKTRVGKLRAEISAVLRAIEQDGFTRLPIRVAHLRVLETLPAHHRDPFDHLLIAQAISEDADFCSADRHAAAYPVRVLACDGSVG